MSRIIAFLAALLLSAVAAAPAHAAQAAAPAEQPCDQALLAKLAVFQAVIEACEVSERLVPGEPTVFVVWNYDQNSPNYGLAIAILDLAAMREGFRKPLFQMVRGTILLPIRYGGTATKLAFGDFDGSGRIGWAIAVGDDHGAALLMRAFAPKSGRFVAIGPARRTENGSVAQEAFPTEGGIPPDIGNGEILVSSCRAEPGAAKPALYFNRYKLVAGRYILVETARDSAQRACPAG